MEQDEAGIVARWSWTRARSAQRGSSPTQLLAADANQAFHIRRRASMVLEASAPRRGACTGRGRPPSDGRSPRRHQGERPSTSPSPQKVGTRSPSSRLCERPDWSGAGNGSDRHHPDVLARLILSSRRRSGSPEFKGRGEGRHPVDGDVPGGAVNGTSHLTRRTADLRPHQRWYHCRSTTRRFGGGTTSGVVGVNCAGRGRQLLTASSYRGQPSLAQTPPAATSSPPAGHRDGDGLPATGLFDGMGSHPR
jgi:hypothetical protein